MTTFPKEFIVLRTQSSRGPYWQLLEAKRISSGLSEAQSFYEITSLPLFNTTYITNQHTYTVEPIQSSKRVQVRTESGEIMNLAYWSFPLYIEMYNQHIPIIHFEYKAWLPKPTYRIPVVSSSELLQRYSGYIQQSLHSEQNENGRRRLFDDLPHRPPTPPSIRGESDDEVDSSDFPPLPPSPPSSPILSKPLPIPEIVGDLLIQNAIKGEDTCPISAIAYKELTKISATSCFHIFDTASIQTWLHQHNQCPVCRNSIVNMISKEIKN